MAENKVQVWINYVHCGFQLDSFHALKNHFRLNNTLLSANPLLGLHFHVNKIWQYNKADFSSAHLATLNY